MTSVTEEVAPTAMEILEIAETLSDEERTAAEACER
jgi:hypothetical protein